MMKTKLTIVFILFCFFAANAQNTVKSIMKPETLWDFGRVSEAKLSPDGKKILYGVATYSLSDNKGKRNLFVYDLSEAKSIQITDDNEMIFNAIWRPDGLKIGYISSKNNGTQIWEMNPDGTNKTQVSNVNGGVNGFLYSPLLNNIVYIADVKLDKDVHDVHPDLPLADAAIYDDLMYRHWNAWTSYTYSHIFIAPYRNSRMDEGKDIMKDEKFHAPLPPYGGMDEITFSPDGKLLAYNSKKLTGKDFAVSTNSDIYIYNIETGKTENISKGMMGYDKCPVFSPDAKMIAWQSMKTPGFESDKERIMLYDFESKAARDITDNFDQSSAHFVWSADNKYIYFISGIKATYQLFKIDINTKEVTQITKGVHNINSFEKNGKTIVAEIMSMSMPTEIYQISESDGKITQLTYTNKDALDKLELAKVEERWVTTTDNKQMLVWVIYPPKFDPKKKYPALLYCQGGPQSAVSQFFSYRWNFQMMAAHGYIVVAPNRRGLPTFGQEWNDQISGDYGGQNMKDYLSAIDAVATEPYVDNTKLGAIGASYGGFSVYWLAGNHNKRFKAFIAHCGMYNFESWYGATEEMFFANHDLGGPFWNKEKPKSYDFSPHNFVGNWDTPILVIHGGKDFRIPYTEGMQAFNAAQMQGIPSRFLYFPNETHFVLKPQNSVLWQREFFKWLDKWLK